MSGDPSYSALNLPLECRSGFVVASVAPYGQVRLPLQFIGELKTQGPALRGPPAQALHRLPPQRRSHRPLRGL